VFVDHIGGDGRLKAEFKPNAIPFSVESNNAKGLDTTVVEATYLIDAAVLRAHVSSGVTLCAKNLFGATSINPDWRKNAHDGFHHNKDGSASYSAFTDFLGHKDLGEKTMLFIIDGLYGNDNVDGPPHRKWKMAPFNDAWPNSIFMSLDSVAIDSVGFDFLTSEWPDLPDIANADNYLRESAFDESSPTHRGEVFSPSSMPPAKDHAIRALLWELGNVGEKRPRMRNAKNCSHRPNRKAPEMRAEAVSSRKKAQRADF
jgi:hypothetical protein